MVVLEDFDNTKVEPAMIVSTPLNHLIKDAILNCEPIDNTLHVITVISNICEFKRRWFLMKEFIKRMNDTPNIQLYVVEIAYGNQDFHITDENNSKHLQLRCEHALWHKENMVNLGIKKLLPDNWKAVAWVDGDIEFDDPKWSLNCLKILNHFDFVQLFTTCMDLDNNEIPMNIWQSYGYKYAHGYPFQQLKGINYWHSGYGWACKREIYEQMGGLFDKGILGSGDYILCQAILKKPAFISHKLSGFKNEIHNFIKKIYSDIDDIDAVSVFGDVSNVSNNIKVGYVPTNIKHYFHGSKINRKYIERNEILIKHNFDPAIHLKYDENGVIIPTELMSADFLQDILHYFSQRNEDE